MLAVSQVLEIAGVAPSAVRLVIHGTTLATNAIIERRGARTALIVTSGHRDALEMARENRFEQYDISIDRPEPLVPRRLRLPVTERVDRYGRVLVPLDEESVGALLPVLDEHGVESVAVGLIHGYANPDHERRVGAILASQRPELAVTLASDACPEIREYERLSTACVNAYVQPLMSRYLKGLAESLAASGLDCPFLLMTSGGGLTTLETAMAAPVRLVESGPAGGAILASHLARRLELGDVLSFDMGGTTAKLCVIDWGRPLQSRAFEVARSYRFKRGSGLPVRIPVIEMVEIGAGGGSIAAVDDLDRIQVGPASAGSEPGPAAYCRGGTDPTVTDADVVLGRIDPAFFAGGAIPLDRERAAAAIRNEPGAKLGLDETEGALGISEMVDENMSNAARTHAVEWGKGLAGRTLVAFGGSAPIHAARLADKLELYRFLVPADAGVGSPWVPAAADFLRGGAQPYSACRRSMPRWSGRSWRRCGRRRPPWLRGALQAPRPPRACTPTCATWDRATRSGWRCRWRSWLEPALWGVTPPWMSFGGPSTRRTGPCTAASSPGWTWRC